MTAPSPDPGAPAECPSCGWICGHSTRCPISPHPRARVSPDPGALLDRMEEARQELEKSHAYYCTHAPVSEKDRLVIDSLLRMPASRELLRLARQGEALVKQAEQRGYERGRRDFQFAPEGDNHHNAALCPYCSPALVADTTGGA